MQSIPHHGGAGVRVGPRGAPGRGPHHRTPPEGHQELHLRLHSGNFTCLEVVFTLKRCLGYYVFHTYIPTCLVVIMSPEIAPACVTLGVTSLLTLFTQQTKSQASLPPVSYIKTIDIFMSSYTVFVFMVLIEYAVVNIILGDGSGDAAKCPAKPEPKPSKATDQVPGCSDEL
ncbi:glycine receptor subunit alpha-2-like isoform X1 [Portunus trituberculatus]|uniref:glycine receptor subunit alpha-2-like isoform X1 n=1 Tax=Portunus trituberculatus TaxID=210409 RepID=UPI001E1D1142|nr:glycine receptor subunit alpha-2-like isoform X1 [Portunus trituberculatus]